MKIIFKLFFLVAVSCFLMTSCAKEPRKEMAEAQAIVQEVVNAGQGKYAQAEIQKLEESLKSALNDVEAKNYSKAREVLQQIASTAVEVKGKIGEEQALWKNMSEAQAIVQEVIDAGQGKYAQAEIQKLEESLKSALNDAEAKNYLKAEELLKQIAPMAEEVKSKISDEQDLLKALIKSQYYAILVRDKDGLFWAIPVAGIKEFRGDKLTIKADTVVAVGENLVEDFLRKDLISMLLKYKPGTFGLNSMSYREYDANLQLEGIQKPQEIIVRKIIDRVKK